MSSECWGPRDWGSDWAEEMKDLGRELHDEMRSQMRGGGSGGGSGRGGPRPRGGTGPDGPGRGGPGHGGPGHGGPGGHHHRGMPPWGAGPPPWVRGMFGGPGGGFGPHRPKVRRGDVRAAILDVLASHSPLNGYQVIRTIGERTGGAWTPSPGSVYPTLQQLEDEDLVETTEHEGRKAYVLTDEGRTYVEGHPEELAATWRPFDADTDDDDTPDLKRTIGQVAAAVWQIAVTGTPHQQEQAREVLSDTRRRLYGLLAEGDEE